VSNFEIYQHETIILVDGRHLLPIATFYTDKQLLPLLDKPMIYYQLGYLMLAYIYIIAIISMQVYFEITINGRALYSHRESTTLTHKEL